MGEDKPLRQERRKSPRFKDNFLILENFDCKPTGGFKALARNISAGGLMFETEKEIPLHSELKLEIYQAQDHDKKIIFSIPVKAKVVWKRKIDKQDFEKGENKYRVALEFLEIAEGDRKMISRYAGAGP
ncbi:MAG: PilZ domain-containing protein [Candidatus Omnitrophica bacterium]|nr:PilZ domain-containing protein [Candidatus Omnitrophota bacterium]